VCVLKEEIGILEGAEKYVKVSVRKPVNKRSFRRPRYRW
jgi:hypothetical protein